MHVDTAFWSTRQDGRVAVESVNCCGPFAWGLHHLKQQAVEEGVPSSTSEALPGRVMYIEMESFQNCLALHLLKYLELLT